MFPLIYGIDSISTISLNDKEIDDLKELSTRGKNVSFQYRPSDEQISLETILSKLD